MVELLAPGVYTVETSFRAPSIQGAGTSTTGFVGICRNGPAVGPPLLVTSFGEFERLFGGLADLTATGLNGAAPTNYLAMSVRGFFNEGGRRLYIARAHQAGAEDGHARVALIGATTADDPHMIIRSRFPGSGANGTITLSEIVTPAAAVALARSGIGTLARSRGQAATPAQAVAISPSGALTDGSALSVSISGATAVNVTFNGTQAQVQAPTALGAATDIPAGAILNLTIDGLAQSVALAEGTGLTRAAIRDQIDAALANGTSVLVGNSLAIRSNARGSGVSVTVQRLDVIGFTDPQATAAGTGMRRLDDIQPADLNLLLTAAGQALVADRVPGTALLRLSTTATGRAATLNLSGSNPAVLTALGFDPAALADPIAGTDGTARRLFVRETAAADGWREYTDAGGGDWAPAGATVDAATQLTDLGHIVTLSLAWESVDGVTTSYEGLGFADDHPRYLGLRMLDVSDPVEMPLNDPFVLDEDGLNAAETHAALFAGGNVDENDVLSATRLLAGGSDGAVPGLVTFQDALARLNLVDDIAIVAAPGSSAYDSLGDAVRSSLIGHAEDSGFRIAVLDPPPAQSLIGVRQTRGQFDSTYGAFYAPWIRISNPLARPGNEAVMREINVPPSGHIAGIYARNDALRGVHKTPANEIIREAVGFETDYNQAHQGVLNPIGVNVLRYLTGRGNRVYGGRLATSTREVVYVSDRRFLNFLKQSIFMSMQWAVFEPNGPELWSDVREAVSSFLFTQWRAGALLGATPEMAYFVICDRSVITQDDLDNGRMICEIGVAITKPAEFVVFRIGQKTADARS